MRSWLGFGFTAGIVVFAAAGCGDDISATPDGGPDGDGGPAVCTAVEDDGPIRAVWSLPRDETHAFFDLPWPDDFRVTEDGTVDVSRFPNPTMRDELQTYLDVITARQRGHGLNGAVYFRFSRAIDTATLPADPEASRDSGASVFIMNVDPDSPGVGTRWPAVFHYRDCPTRFWAHHTLAVRPVYGFPLDGATTYAVVVTKDVRPSSGTGADAYAVDADLQAVLDGAGGDPALTRAGEVYGPALDVLAMHGVARDAILSLSVITTQDAVGELVRLRDWIVSSYTAPTAVMADWRWRRNEVPYELVEGRYGPSPILMQGELPFTTAGTGDILYEADGTTPMVAQELDPRFALTIPKTTMPAAGYPIAIYQHGTGGDWQSFVADGTADSLTREGVAVIGVDQIHHGERNPTMDTNPDYLFFNFLNPLAARNNNRQSALDVVQQARFVRGLTVPTTIVMRGGMQVHFDPAKVYYFGHSQGGLNGPLFLAVDDTARGAVLSGAGATLPIALIEKTEPISILLAVYLFLGLPGSSAMDAVAREDFTYEHPVVTLLSAWVDSSDPSAYVHMLFHAPREGFAPKSILQTEGFMDDYAPPAGIESLAAAAHIPLIEPVHRPIEALELRGLMPLTAPVTGNVGAGMATAGLLQYPMDGHFAALRNDDAKMRIRMFFRTMIDDPVPTIP